MYWLPGRIAAQYDRAVDDATRRAREERARLRLERAVLIALGFLAVLIIGQTLIDLFIRYPYGVDLEIPLRAARRFADGGQAYLASAFAVIVGPDLPFLYPPVTLPFLVPLLSVPRELLFGTWTFLVLCCGVFACRRLAIPWWAVPIALAWAPFAEALLGGNIQVPLLAAFTAVVYRSGGLAFRPIDRDPRSASSAGRAVLDGTLATLIGAIKVSQGHTWLFVLRRRPAAALAGAAIVAGVCLVTLPLVGLQSWFDWLGQAGKSGDPNWQAVGWPLSVYLGRPLGLLLTVLSLVAMFFVPMRRAGAWIGLLSIVGAPSLHMFGMLFLIPALLEIRREIALFAVFAIGTYTGLGLIGGSLVAGIAFALSGKVPAFARREPSAPAPNRSAPKPAAAPR